jgi:hypothetical protein
MHKRYCARKNRVLPFFCLTFFICSTSMITGCAPVLEITQPNSDRLTGKTPIEVKLTSEAEPNSLRIAVINGDTGIRKDVSSKIGPSPLQHNQNNPLFQGVIPDDYCDNPAPESFRLVVSAKRKNPGIFGGGTQITRTYYPNSIILHVTGDTNTFFCPGPPPSIVDPCDYVPPDSTCASATVITGNCLSPGEVGRMRINDWGPYSPRDVVIAKVEPLDPTIVVGPLVGAFNPPGVPIMVRLRTNNLPPSAADNTFQVKALPGASGTARIRVTAACFKQTIFAIDIR